MLSDQDLKQIKARGISEEQVEYQLNQFKTGFPFLKLESAAGIGNGIISPDEDARKKSVECWNEYKQEGHKVVKFVPASGAQLLHLRRSILIISVNSPSVRLFVTSARRMRRRVFVHCWRKETIKQWHVTCWLLKD